jgi:hypothetical protein
MKLSHDISYDYPNHRPNPDPAWLESRRNSEAWRHKIEAEASRCSCFPASGELGDGDASSITGVSSSTSSSNEEEALCLDDGATEWGIFMGDFDVQIYHLWIFIPTKMWMNVNGCVYICDILIYTCHLLRRSIVPTKITLALLPSDSVW